MKKLLIYLLLILFLGACDASEKQKLMAEFDNGIKKQLANAVNKGDSNFIEHYLANKGDVNISSEKGTSLLYLTIALEQKEIFDLLLKSGADYKIKRNGDHKLTVLDFAASQKHQSYYLRKLLENGANPNLLNEDTPQRPTPIFYAVDNFNTDNLKILAEYGALLDIQNNYGETPMIFTANINQFDMVYILLELGADYEIKHKWNKSIIYNLKHNIVDPNSDLAVWRDKSIEFLKNKGVKFKNE